jgi:hypothetical protein
MHNHYCDAAGHEYECSDDCECICGLPMENSDHSDCPIELRACPEHPADQERPMVEVEPGAVKIDFGILSDEHQPAIPHCNCGCADVDQEESVGFCVWCSHVYVDYSPAIENQHFAYHCPEAPEELKSGARLRLANG